MLPKLERRTLGHGPRSIELFRGSLKISKRFDRFRLRASHAEHRARVARTRKSVLLRDTTLTTRSQVRQHLRLQDPHQFRIHKLKPIRNFQADNLLALEIWPEPGGQPPALTWLHDENEVGPFDQFRCHRIFRIVIQTGRRDFNPRMRFEDPFRCRAPQPVASADKKDTDQHDFCFWIQFSDRSFAYK